jgi:hypothetical protein
MREGPLKWPMSNLSLRACSRSSTLTGIAADIAASKEAQASRSTLPSQGKGSDLLAAAVWPLACTAVRRLWIASSQGLQGHLLDRTSSPKRNPLGHAWRVFFCLDQALGVDGFDPGLCEEATCDGPAGTLIIVSIQARDVATCRIASTSGEIQFRSTRP